MPLGIRWLYHRQLSLPTLDRQRRLWGYVALKSSGPPGPSSNQPERAGASFISACPPGKKNDFLIPALLDLSGRQTTNGRLCKCTTLAAPAILWSSRCPITLLRESAVPYRTWAG